MGIKRGMTEAEWNKTRNGGSRMGIKREMGIKRRIENKTQNN